MKSNNVYHSLLKMGLALLVTSALSAGSTPTSAPTTYPEGELGRMVKLGEAILNETDTHPLTKDMVGNTLQCKNCHLKGSDGKPGTGLGIGTFIGTATSFPAYSKREKTIQTLQNRSNNCFMRSMNGMRPIVDSEVSMAMAAYISWLSTGIPMNMNAKMPTSPLNTKRWATKSKTFASMQKKATHANYVNGKKLFTQKCVSCHGSNGEGMGTTFPPLWGQAKDGKWLSYNTGAGMSKLNKSAAWVQSNMPFAQENSLNDQEAADIALYFNAQPRAKFDLEKRLYPKSEMGYYNSKVLKEKHSVRSNFKDFGLNIDDIRGDHKIR